MNIQRWLLLAGVAVGGGGWLLGYDATARADGGFYCDKRIVSEGDAAYRVRSLCGTPDDVQQRLETRVLRNRVRVPCRTGFCDTIVENAITVPVEEWTYDFGRTRFVQYVIFEQGHVIKIRSGGYGVKDIAPAEPPPEEAPPPPPPAATDVPQLSAAGD